MGYRELGYRGQDRCLVVWVLLSTALVLAFPAAFPRPADVSAPIAFVFLGWAMVVRVLARLKVEPGTFLWVRVAALPLVAVLMTRLSGPLAVPLRRDVLGLPFDLIAAIDPLSGAARALAAGLPDTLVAIANAIYVLAFGAPIVLGAVLARRGDDGALERFSVAAFRALLACWVVHLFVPSWPLVGGAGDAGPSLAAASGAGTGPGFGAVLSELLDRLGGPAAGAFPSELAAVGIATFLASRRLAPRASTGIAIACAAGCVGAFAAGRAGFLDVVAGLLAGAGAYAMTEWLATRATAAEKGAE